VLAIAHSDGQALLTHNRKEFRRLHNADWTHSGMVLCTADTNFRALSARVDHALSRSTT
jgi:hypothetical protein